MPGLAGFVSTDDNNHDIDLETMLDALGYGCAVIAELYKSKNISFGCIHLGTGGQKALYQSDKAVVLFFGYLTHPNIPPGADPSDPCSAAHYIHDQYLLEGEKAMQKISGAFAIAIWDKKVQRLLLITDHLGQRPIYYSTHNGILRFASEVKGILSDSLFPHNINETAFAEFFYFGHLLEEKTFFEDIRLIPPGSILLFQDGVITINKYWDIHFPEAYPHHSDRWYDDLINNAIETSVKKMIRPELKYGLSLSGGLDSRWIAAYMGKYSPDSLSFTLGIPGSDDTPIAEQVAMETKLSHQYWELSTDYIAKMGEIYTYLVDGMDPLTSMDEFPLLSRMGDYVDVSVGGLLGGPAFGYYMDLVSANLRKIDVKKYFLWRNVGKDISSLFGQVFGLKKGREFELMALESLDRCIKSAPNERGFQVYQYITLRYNQNRSSNLAQLAKLAFVDIYHPLTDKDVVAAALQLPAGQLILEQAYRRAMVSHFPKLGKILWTYTLTPLSISTPAALTKKVAQHTLGLWLRNTRFADHPLIRPRRYYTDYYQWSRTSLRTFIEETLLNPGANAAGLFDAEGLRRVVYDHMDGKQFSVVFIGQALAVALWTRNFYTPSSPIRPDGLLFTAKNEER